MQKVVYLRKASFNRYMVECELILIVLVVWVIAVLIDTWWNVNVDETGRGYPYGYGFNRYMVECE